MHGHNIHSLATVNYQLPRGGTLFHHPLTNILENIQRLFTSNPKIFKDFFACKFVLAAIHQQPGNIQRLSCLQNCRSRKSSTIFRKYSKTFWAINSSDQQQQSTATINSSNQQQQSTATINSSNRQHQPSTATSSSNSSNQQQQSTATINSSNQQQQSTATINSSNRQQQSTATINSSNRQHQPSTATSSSNSSNQQQQSTAAINSSNQQRQPAAASDNNNQLQRQPAFVLPAPLPQSTTTHVR